MAYESLVAEYLDFKPPAYVARSLRLDLPAPARNNIIHALTGVRRCGKTYRLYQLMDELRERGVPRERILYFTFDDDRLSPMDESTASQVLDAFLKLVPEAQQGFYLLLDEIQEAPGWERFVRRVSERHEATIVLTGSSSKLLSRDIPTQLRGRSLATEMWPLSFREYCDFHGVKRMSRGTTWPKATALRLEKAFSDYLDVGGFPAVQRLPALLRTQLLQTYQAEIVTKDVFERFGATSLRVGERFARAAMRSTGLSFSVNAQLKALRAAGASVSTKSLYDLLDDLEDAHLLFKVSEYDRSIKENPKAAYKVYSVDPGLSLAVAPASHMDLGQRLETAAFIELKRRYGGDRTRVISSYSCPGCPEVDFVVGDVALGEQHHLIQVCVGLGEDGPAAEKRAAREIGNLEVAMRACGLSEGTIVTLDEERDVAVEQGVIHVVPAWKWFLTTGE